MSAWRRVLREMVAAVVAAVVAGVLLGGIARLLMRLAAVAAGHAGNFSLAGTLGIVTAFAVVALPGAMLASLRHGRGRSALLVLGSLLLCIPATSVARSDLAALGPLSPPQWVGVALATGGVYAAILSIPVLTLRLLARSRLARSEPQREPAASV